jgi:hypothetical protein
VEAGGQLHTGGTVRALRQQLGIALGTICALAVLAPSAHAAAPAITAVWSSNVQPTTARLNAEVSPNGKQSSYRFDYILKSTYDANVAGAKDPFAGTSRLPALADTIISGLASTTIAPTLFGLAPDTAYRYRLVIKNADGTTTGPTRDLRTHSAAPFALPDNRGWEMVSPVEKNGGEVEPPGALAGGGVLQAAADGQSVTYGSAASFGGGAQGAAVASQYISSRGAGGWSTLNITPPLISGSYGSEPTGVPYQLFSPDLAWGLMLNGRPCRGDASGCPVANPPLTGTDAPAGYQNYYLREGGSFEALLGSAEIGETDLDAADFELSFAGSSPDLKAVVLSSCAALTASAGDGCSGGDRNLYLWSGGALTLINATPGAQLGAQSGAVSTDGSRVYFTDTTAGNLHLHQGAVTKQADIAAGGGGTFQTATPDGAFAFFTESGHLWRYDAVADTATDLTPGGGVVGVLGASADGTRVYFKDAGGVKLWSNGTTTMVASAADASNYPPASGTARVSADGTKLIFLSTTALTTSDGLTYDNTGLNSKAPTSQLYLYDASGAGTLACLSCNPTHARPIGPSSIPGATANGIVPGSTHAYKPRVLSPDGRRVFFESEDALVLTDVNLGIDVYQWQAQGKGSCSKAGGCISLISSGLANWATFIDASATGDDAFFITDRSLIGADPSATDLYDAKVGGGFPEPTEPSPCIGDACQVVPPAVEDPVLTTVLAGPGNPKEQYRAYGAKAKKKCPKGKVRKGGKCVKRKSARAKKGVGKKSGVRR